MSRSKRTPKRKEQFLKALSEGASVGAAAKSAGLSRRSAYDWKKDDALFSDEWDSAVELGTDCLEDEARRRAAEGVDEPQFYKGAVVGFIRRYSDTLLIFMLKARRPEKYRETPPPGTGGQDVLKELLKESKEEWKRGENAAG